MIDLTTISEQVTKEQGKKSDVAMKLRDLAPTMTMDGNPVLIKGLDTYGFTKSGLSSYLNKINVPQGFFNKCSEDLKRDILKEHHAKTENSDVFARLYDDKIRYLASTRYGVFDDIHVVDALRKVENLSTLKIKQFSQSEDHFILRALAEEPIEIRKGRPFFPGIQIYNSETGKSSIKIQLMLWEQVCTNGLTVPRELLKSVVKKHLGSKFTSDALALSAHEVIEFLPEFVNQAKAQIGIMSKISGQDVMDRIEKNEGIPKKIKERMPLLLPNYAPTISEANGMDVISSYTEAIQEYNWEQRTHFEDMAGFMLFGN